MKNLSIFGNFLKSFVFVFLTLGVLSSEVFGVGCDDSLDNDFITNNANSNTVTSSMVTIPGLDGATGDVTKCISGTSTNHESQSLAHDFYKFTVKTAGTLKITTSSPNGKQFHFYVGKNGSTEYRNTVAITHNIPDINLTVDDYIIVWAKETGNDLDEYQINFNFVKTVDLSKNNEVDFDTIYTGNAYSKMRILGNTSLCKKGSRRTTGDGNGVYGCDTRGAGTSITNNKVDMINNDYDDVKGISGNVDTTINSSAAFLDMPADKKVLWAGLFWQGKLTEKTTAEKETVKNVKFKHQDEANYTPLVSQKTNWISKVINFSTTVHTNPTYDYFVYQGFYDVTEQVNNNGGGYYWVGDIISVEGDDKTIAGGSYAGWSLTVVYEDQNETMRNTTVYHGYKEVAQGKPVSTTLTGFLTPQEGDVSSELFIFASDGDTGATWSSTLESITVTDKSNTEHKLYNTLNPKGDLFNSTITRDGATVTSGLPYSSPNSLGIDIDSYNVGTKGFIKNAQTETTIKIASENSDGFYLGTLALETELYVPELCYDYAYSQNDVFLTEENFEAHDPRLISRNGSFATNSPINVMFYIRNTEASDTISSDTKFYLLDINTSEAQYVLESTEVTPPNSFAESPFADDVNTSISQIYNVYNGAVKAHEFFYVYFDLDPQIRDINMSLNARLDYTVQMFDEDDKPLLADPMKYEIMLNDEIELCAENPFVYQPEKGIFNIVHNAFWNTTPSNTSDLDVGARANGSDKSYNLPTQVVNRAGNFHLISLDPDVAESVDGGLNTLKSTETIVGLEVIDAGGWADATTTCTDSRVSRSPVIWIPFQGTTNAPVSATQIENALSVAGYTDTTLFTKAIESAAFRLTYQLSGDGNDTILQIKGNDGDGTASSGSWNVENFADAAKGPCTGDPDGDGNFNDQVSDWCDNAGASSTMTNLELAQCMVCINGKFSKKVCSRDNFAIRPEAFLLEISDINQTNASSPTKIIGGDSPLTLTQLAAGYNYKLKTTATTHTDNNASIGYYKTFSETAYVSDSSTDDELSYTWVPTADDTKCNDTNSTHAGNSSISLANGLGDVNSSMSQAGIYALSMHDSQWTKSDFDFSTPNHPHQYAPNFFRTGAIDCDNTQSSVSENNSSALNGCAITSLNTNANDATLNLVDQTYQFNPYKFEVTNSLKVGLNASSPDATNPFVYMADIGKPSDLNMSIQLTNNITAQGHNSVALTNFVNECYAKPLDYNITKTAHKNTNLIYMSKMRDTNATTVAYIDNNISKGKLDKNISIPIPTTYFPKASKGVAKTKTFLNFYRENNVTANPEDINYTALLVAQSTSVNLHADMKSDKHSDANVTLNQRFIHYYARSAARKTEVRCLMGECKSGANGEPEINIKYEVFCLNENLPNHPAYGNSCSDALKPVAPGVSSLRGSDSRWSVNFDHNETVFGRVGDITDLNNPGATVIVGSRNPAGFKHEINPVHSYNKSHSLPYPAIMKDIVPSWLNYNDYGTDGKRDVPTNNNYNQHFVIFKSNSVWSGNNDTNVTTDTKYIKRVNRRTMW